jgi:signal transduction histidine kinase
LRMYGVSKNFKPIYTRNLAFPGNVLPGDKFLHDHFLSYNETIVVPELKELEEPKLEKTLKLLDELNIVVLVPLVVKNDVIGLLALGPKESRDIYNNEDLRVLKMIAAQGATAIENARLYAEVQAFGATLQKKVDEQTREIKAKAEHLKKLMDMRSEFLDITSHQLRTPVSVIKGVLSMLEEGSIPKDREKDFIKGAMEKSIKLGEIINDILRASEMDSDKFTMTIRSIDLNEMMKKINDDKVRSAEMKKLKFFMDVPELPPVWTDPKYVEHAIVNLINNSIQYTVEGSITVTAEVNPTHVIIRVTDTGIGIPPEAREKLFTKFARAANAVTTFTDGTGLGLFIIKQIVDANPGAKIEIERTEVNKGTTFAYWLPRADQPQPVEGKV